MKIIIIYKSRTGFTKRYAEWIREELKCEIADYDDIKKLYINNYDLLIYGGRVHAGKIDSLENIKRLSDSCKCSLIVYATGATPIAATSEIKKIMESNFSDHKVPHFYMPSGLCYERMSFTDKTVMKMLSKILSAKANKTDVEHGTATAIIKSYDISDKRFIKPLIEYVKNEYFKSSS